MPNINDRIGSQNVIRVLSNASAPPTRLVNLSDVDSTRKTEDGMILVWDRATEIFYMTDSIDSAGLSVSGIVTFSNTTDSTGTGNGALNIAGGLGVAKHLNVGAGLSVVGVATFLSNLDLDGNVDIAGFLKVNSTFTSVGVTTLASAGGITTTGGNLYVGDDLFVRNDLKVDGTSEFIGIATFRGGTINLGDSDSDDVNVGGEFISNLTPNDDDLYDIGIDSKRWRNGKFSGIITTTNLEVGGVSTFRNTVDIDANLDITGDTDQIGNQRVVGFVSVTEGLRYEGDDYDGPNGIAYFDNNGRLIGAASTENALTETYFILTTNAVGIPTWTSVIDGGEF